MAYKYTFKGYNKEHMARAVLESVPISFKSAIMVSNAIKNKELNKAKNILKQAMEKKTPIKFTKFNQEQAHRRAIGPGKYPVKTAKYMLKLLNEVEANAQFIGLDTSSLIIYKIICQEAARSLHYGRRRSISMKRTTVEIVVKEASKDKSKEKKKSNNKSVNNQVKAKKSNDKKVVSKSKTSEKSNKTESQAQENKK